MREYGEETRSQFGACVGNQDLTAPPIPRLDASQNAQLQKEKLEGVPEDRTTRHCPISETRNVLRTHVKGHRRCL